MGDKIDFGTSGHDEFYPEQLVAFKQGREVITVNGEDYVVLDKEKGKYKLVKHDEYKKGKELKDYKDEEVVVMTYTGDTPRFVDSKGNYFKNKDLVVTNRANLPIDDKTKEMHKNIALVTKLMEDQNLMESVFPTGNVVTVKRNNEAVKLSHAEKIDLVKHILGYTQNVVTKVAGGSRMQGGDVYASKIGARSRAKVKEGEKEVLSYIPDGNEFMAGETKYDKEKLEKTLAQTRLRRPVYIKTKKVKKGTRETYEIDKKFQADVQKYIKSLNPELQLPELNMVQSSCPFLIADPNMSRLKTGVNAVYGFADLLRFLGWNYESNILKSEKNPFYSEIKYPFPDVYGNLMFSRMRNLYNYDSLFNNLRSRVHVIEKEYKQNPKSNHKKRNNELSHIVKTAKNVIDELTSPVNLSRLLPDMQRPMDTYRRGNFYKTLIQFNQLHKLHPTSKGEMPPDSTKIQLLN